MIRVRKSSERGSTDLHWLHSKHSFSFGEYYDPAHEGFGVLRVINEDIIEGGTGFGEHSHADMEIISYVINGELRHRDSMGNTTIIGPGEIQRMSAGTGIRHSEYNNLTDRQTHFLQIWVVPDKKGHPPSYDQIRIKEYSEKEGLIQLISATPRENTITLHQDVAMYLGRAMTARNLHYALADRRKAWIQLVRGGATLDGTLLGPGDGAAVEGVSSIDVKAAAGSEFLLFDLPEH